MPDDGKLTGNRLLDVSIVAALITMVFSAIGYLWSRVDNMSNTISQSQVYVSKLERIEDNLERIRVGDMKELWLEIIKINQKITEHGVEHASQNTKQD